MGEILMTGGSGGGTGSDECTATLDHVLAGKTAVTKDSHDEPGNGRMTVNSLLSFSVAAYSGRRVLAKWQNPKAAIGKPYSGVYIRYSTSGYPGKTGGTQIYKGAGSNTASQGQSQTYLDMPALNTTYYLSIYPYVTCSAGEMTGNPLNTTVRTSAEQVVTIKGTQNYTIPIGYTKADICAVGGGAGGRGGWEGPTAGYAAGGGVGGGGGYVNTVKGISVSAGQVLSAIVGAGGRGGYGGDGNYGDGGATSSVTRSGTVLVRASGGKADGDGGSGGGGMGRYYTATDNPAGGAGGSDGSDGKTGDLPGGKGQGTTTRAFGNPSGTLYAPGGGGGGATNGADGGAGGAVGGGKGGKAQWRSGGSESEGYEYMGPYAGSNGTANTGGGGGGGGGAKKRRTPGAAGGNGGSGVVLIRLY